MRILVTGSRIWEDESAIAIAIIEVIEEAGVFPTIDGMENVTIVHGNCPTGADQLADDLAVDWQDRYGLKIERHPADWNQYGKRAGFVRNAEMVKLGANVCLAFIKNKSKGATMTADLAEKSGIRVKRFVE